MSAKLLSVTYVDLLMYNVSLLYSSFQLLHSLTRGSQLNAAPYTYSCAVLSQRILIIKT